LHLTEVFGVELLNDVRKILARLTTLAMAMKFETE